MNYSQSIEILTSQEKFYINLGLERMQKLAEIFSNPQNDLKIIHVAGTNGKGSVCAMLAAILQGNGFKTGLYTSPHIKSYTERFKINFNNMSEENFAKYLQIIENTAKDNEISLTEFEILTMMAFLYFKDEKTDFVILETGMGGRLDATNIVLKPLLTIITSVSSDHTDRLGKTIGEIAAEKAGILKQNVPLVISKNNKGFNTINEKAKILQIPVFATKKDFELINCEKNIFSNESENYELSLKGINQGQNLALVVEACKLLKLPINYALKNVCWQSRMQYLKEKNLLVDAAHNPDAVRLLKENLGIYFKKQKRIFLFGVLNTKDYKKIIENLFDNNDIIFVTDNFAQNSVRKEILIAEIQRLFPKAKVKPIELEKINEFLEKDVKGIKICCGSFYLCSKVL